MSVKRFTGNANEVDEDVVEEEKRVKNIHPDSAPARLEQVSLAGSSSSGRRGRQLA